VHAFANDHAIACDVNPCDTIDVIYDEGQWAQAQASVAMMQAVLPEDDPAAEYTLLSRGEVLEKFFCHDNTLQGEEEKLCGGVLYPAGSLSGYKFGVGVLKMCLAKGLNLQTNTPATGVSKNGDGTWNVQTPRGTIITRRVVVATNGYTANLLPIFQGVIVPLRGQITAQRPGRSLPHDGSLPTTYSFIYANGYEYMITRPAGTRFAGDVVIGGGLARAPDEGLLEYGTTDDGSINKAISVYLHDTTPRYFGSDWGIDNAAGRVRAEWTGIMGYSPDGFPFVGEIPGEDKGLWISASFQGHGMVFCWMCARALVEMMSGRDGDGLQAWFPDAFRVDADRLKKRFEGRLHTRADT
jgi:glycine/D-amino acid oxidase-like deaminating enzyme